MKKVLAALLLIPIALCAQQTDTLTQKRDSLAINTDSSINTTHSKSPEVYNGAKIDFKTYFNLLGQDFAQQLTSPLHAKGKDWLKAGEAALFIGALAFTDKPVNRFAIDLHDDSKGFASASKFVTDFGAMYEIYTVGGLYASGLILHDQKLKNTTALATQSYITAVTISSGAKYVFGEQRPYYTDPLDNRKGPIFRGPFYPFKKGVSFSDYASFPSGHATAAFAVATVYAMEYRDKPLIPILSYGAATLVALSRLTENKHWPTDIAAGAIIGYFSGRQVVHNYHRYSNMRQAGVHNSTSVSFNLQYNYGQIIPGLVYVF